MLSRPGAGSGGTQHAGGTFSCPDGRGGAGRNTLGARGRRRAPAGRPASSGPNGPGRPWQGGQDEAPGVDDVVGARRRQPDGGKRVARLRADHGTPRPHPCIPLYPPLPLTSAPDLCGGRRGAGDRAPRDGGRHVHSPLAGPAHVVGERHRVRAGARRLLPHLPGMSLR